MHIPFCRRKCLYCDFPSFAGMEAMQEAYVDALSREILRWGVFLSGNSIDTIYVGGGTPTLLSADKLTGLLDGVIRNLPVASAAEISVEANPGTADLAKLKALRSAGFNRLSLGVQSFSDTYLAALGRIHSAQDAVRTVEAARRAGFDNINVDLMYGLPGQVIADFAADLSQAVKLGVEHISVYGLIIEEGTPFFERHQNGSLQLPGEDEEEAMYDLMVSYLPEQSYDRYEISNYARSGYECRHNLKYWHFDPYIGVGAGAHSFYNNQRGSNPIDLPSYIEAAGRGPQRGEELATADAMAEFAFLGLRTVRGVDKQRFLEQFHCSFDEVFGSVVARLAAQSLLIQDDRHVALTPVGMKFGNQVFAEFLL